MSAGSIAYVAVQFPLFGDELDCWGRLGWQLTIAQGVEHMHLGLLLFLGSYA